MTEEKKLTTEMKAKFFAQYYGQDVARHSSSRRVYSVESIFRDKVYDEDYLELKSLSQITDEDAEAVCLIVYGHHIIINEEGLREQIEQLITISSSWSDFKIIDYLRSKGYAVEWLGISVEEQIKLGWIKLKE